MNTFQDLIKENLHHAHLVIGDFDSVEEELLEFLEEGLGVETIANEFYILEKYDKFLVDDARKIFDIHLRKTPMDKIQVIVLTFNFITREAQNAILKMLEEPKERTYFFLIAPSKNLFLETILSRVNLIEREARSEKREAKEFLKMNLGERIKFIADLVKDIKDEKKTKQHAVDLLSGLEVEFSKKAKGQQPTANSLKAIIEARKYINISGASVKILLETVALNV